MFEMIYRVLGAVVLTALLVPETVLARGWTVLALGTAASIEECQAKALEVFKRQGSTLQLQRTGTHVVAYGLQEREIDGSIACARSDDGRVTASLSLHTWTASDDLEGFRLELGMKIGEYW
ncbi:MAG: hypothetical protein AAGC81_09225 [Pseudomonadota bacterium]